MFPYDPKKYRTWFIAGEKEGLKRIKKFLADKKRTAEFEKPKTLPTALDPDTTALSPYISNGSLSARTFWHGLQEATSGAKNKSKPPVPLEGQLMWREMAYLIGYTYNFEVPTDLQRRIFSGVDTYLTIVYVSNHRSH